MEMILLTMKGIMMMIIMNLTNIVRKRHLSILGALTTRRVNSPAGLCGIWVG